MHRTLAPAPLLLLLLTLGSTGCEQRPAPPAEAGEDDAPAAPRSPAVRDTVLEEAFRAAATEIDGTVGVAVRHLERDVHASLNGDRPFALASVAKLPVAYAALQGDHIDPADSVAVEPTDRAPGTTPLQPGTAVPVARLVERSLAHSDNTASDVLLRLAGGADEVSRRIHALDGAVVRDLRVDRAMRQIFADWHGSPDASDERDTGTPQAVVALLAALYHGEQLSGRARRLLLDALEASDTGPNRIRGGVPADATVRHKTGTIGPLTHDAGIIMLPQGSGAVALAVLVESDAPLAARERVIAAVARAVWDRFADHPTAHDTVR